MPNRIIKESITTSDQIDRLSPEAEVLFYRLMVVCDDFGLFDGRAKVIASRCYPLKSIDSRKVQVLLGQLQGVGLAFLYEIDGKPYLKLTGWEKHQQIRAKRAKYPIPDSTCNQLQSNAPVIQSNPIQSESNDMSGKPDVPPLNGYKDQAREILSFLNAKTGRNYQPVDVNLEFIVARLREGVSADDLRSVVAKKCREWSGDEKMAQYLRPATLFNKTKFHQYHGELKNAVS